MKNYFELDLAAPGGPGERSVTDGKPNSTNYSSLHVVFESWLGDELVHVYPCFLVSEFLGSKLLDGGLTGFELRDVEVEKEIQFDVIYGDMDLPRFRWLHVNGRKAEHDFFLDDQFRLVVSEQALDIIETANNPTMGVDEYLR